jgi:hypothetical protein
MSSPLKGWDTGSGPDAARICGNWLCLFPMCRTMHTAAFRSAGRPAAITERASTPPADAPTTMISWVGKPSLHSQDLQTANGRFAYYGNLVFKYSEASGSLEKIQGPVRMCYPWLHASSVTVCVSLFCCGFLPVNDRTFSANWLDHSVPDCTSLFH